MATNVPGPRNRLRLMGREVIRLLPIPPLALQLRTGIAMLSYADHLAFGIIGDYDAAPDVNELADGIERAVSRLACLSGHWRSTTVGSLALARRMIAVTKGQEMEALNRRQCLDLLQEVRVGRLVFTEDALPAVQPVNFRLWRDDVVIRVAGGPKLAAATDNQVVAFQTDELDADLRTGWSVTVVGHAEPITDVEELVELSGTFLQPWVNGRRDHFVRIRTEKMTGRRFRERGVPQYRGRK